MSQIGTYSIPSIAESYTYEYDNVDDLLNGLLDNITNDIDAIDVRNAVYTLWNRINTVQTTVSAINNGVGEFVATMSLVNSVTYSVIHNLNTDSIVYNSWDDLTGEQILINAVVTTNNILDVSSNYDIPNVRIVIVGGTASSLGTASNGGGTSSDCCDYIRTTPTPISVGGVSIGTTFSGSVQDALDKILYPYIGPASSLTIGGSNPREFGSSTAVVLNWTATKHSNNINSIIVDSLPISPTGNTQTGVKNAVGTYSLSASISQTNVYGMSVGDGTQTSNNTATLTWMNKRYWGFVDLSSISNPNLGTNPSVISQVNTIITDSVIRNLTGAGVSPGNELATNFSKTYSNIDGGGKYLVFAWPTIFGTPTFVVNGLQNTAFTKVRNGGAFVNANGYTINYDVWVSNTAYNSPCNLIIS